MAKNNNKNPEQLANLDQKTADEVKFKSQPLTGSADNSQEQKTTFNLSLESTKRLLKIFLITVIFVFFCYNANFYWQTLQKLLVIIRPFLIGGALAFVLKIPINKFENLFTRLLPNMSKTLGRAISLLLSLVISLFVIFGIFTMVLPILVQSIVRLQSQIPTFINTILTYAEGNKYLAQFVPDVKETLNSFSWDLIFNQVVEFLKNGYGQIFSSVVNTAGSIFNGVFNGIIAAMFMIYLLLAKEKLAHQNRQILYATLSSKVADRILYFFYLLDSNFQGFIKGQIIDASILGLMTFACMTVFGIPYALMISVLITITDLVPIIGPLIGVFASTILLVIENPVKGLIFFIIILILQQIEANIIYPRVVGNEVGLPAMWTLVAISVGGSLMGVVGMWLFVPLFAVFYAIAGDYSRRRIVETRIDLSQKKPEHILPHVKKRDLEPRKPLKIRLPLLRSRNNKNKK